MVLKTFKKGEIPNDSQKEYHRFDRIATKMYGAAGSNCRTTIHIGQLRKNKNRNGHIGYNKATKTK
jgi:hypothetical protein